MPRIPLSYLATVAMVAWSGACFANDVTVTQQNLSFDRESIHVAVGDTIHFLNKDDEFHNIFSLSDDATFDLGAFGRGEERSYTFASPGTVEVECAIHPGMQLTVDVGD